MGLNSKELFHAILENIGFEDNINYVSFEKDRIKLNLKNMTLVKEENLKKLNSLLGIIEDNSDYYIIIEKPMNVKVYNEFRNLNKELVKTSEIRGKEKNVFNRFKDIFKKKDKSYK